MMEGQKIRLDWIKYGSPKSGKSESSHLFIVHRDKLIFCLKYLLNKDEEYRFFGLILDSSLIHNELLGTRSDKDKLKGLRNKRKL